RRSWRRSWRRRRRRSPPKQGRRPWTAGTRPPPRPPTAAHPERSLARLGPARCAGPAPAGHDRGRGARAPARAAGQPELNGKEATCRLHRWRPPVQRLQRRLRPLDRPAGQRGGRRPQGGEHGALQDAKTFVPRDTTRIDLNKLSSKKGGSLEGRAGAAER
ncbi:unnamed protein product, partial [Prorocentrum cordatum]